MALGWQTTRVPVLHHYRDECFFLLGLHSQPGDGRVGDLQAAAVGQFLHAADLAHGLLRFLLPFLRGGRWDIHLVLIVCQCDTWDMELNPGQ